MGKIRVAAIGVGNCTSSLVQGRYYYEKFKINKEELINGKREV